MNTFFITGFPRTRTAWLANFFTYGNSFCFHEAIKQCNNITDLKDLFVSTGKQYVGNSDSVIPFFAKRVNELFPQAKWVIIERDEQDVIKSLDRVLPGSEKQNVLNIGKPLLTWVKKTCNPLMINFSELSTQRECKRIWEYCLPTIPFDEMRWKMLDKLRIELILDESTFNVEPYINLFKTMER